MSKQYLQMKYHPAKKEVEFHRFQSGKEIPISRDSKLRKYENEHGHFVLQDHGNAFFDDIVNAFDGERTVEIKAVTTKIDFEDFLQMVEFYNENSSVKITATLLAELPNMEDTYVAVKKHGEKAISILKGRMNEFLNVNRKNQNVEAVVDNFSSDVQKEIDSIKNKISSMADNNVNLCFAGVYSSGKSALINAILGYAILPVNISSETAKMYCIKSPKENEKVRIAFSILSTYSEIVWNERKNIFEFVAGPVESSSRKKIQDTINENKEALQHTQILKILDTLNKDADISSRINVYFPIPLDTDKVQFTIYDTPGTDSNFGEHQSVLKDALSEQTHSILIFVAVPNKTEGHGNNSLLQYLREAEKKDSKTSIDLGRSLFVMNFADMITYTDREKLQNAEIKDADDESYSIKLYDKKLFFTSAKYAYAARAVQNKIASEDDEYYVKTRFSDVSNEKYGRYYQQNHCATSESLTKLMLERSSEALQKAMDNDDKSEVIVIGSGLYALENEIKLYGEKYAVAVKAYAIIDSVDKALCRMNTKAEVIESNNQDRIDAVNREITELKTVIADQIKDEKDNFNIAPNKPLPSKILEALHLDSHSITECFVTNPRNTFEKMLKKWFLGILGSVFVDNRKKNEITDYIKMILNDFTNNYNRNREKSLKDHCNLFISAVKAIIQNNGKLSDEAVKFITDIREPEIPNMPSADVIARIFDSNTNSKYIFGHKLEYIDKENFIMQAQKELNTISAEICQKFEKDYRQTLGQILNYVQEDFIENINKYSLLMQAKLEDKKALEELHEKISAAAKDLDDCQMELNNIIWSVKNDEH